MTTLYSNGLIEQHFHGAFGVDFSTCSVTELLFLTEEIVKNGVTQIFPTLVTDSLQNLKKQINVIKEAKARQTIHSAKIVGVHLEGPFITKNKKGIHNEELIIKPSIDAYKHIEDEIIKIVTISPDEDEEMQLSNYLRSRGVKVSAGHTLSVDLSLCDQVTHLFNAMGTVDHKKQSTATSALINDDIFVELIADSTHVVDDVLRLSLKIKPDNKILLISDSLPIAHSTLTQMEFCSETIYKKESIAINQNGTLAGSVLLLNDIVKNIVHKNIASFDDAIKMASTNQLNYHNLSNNSRVKWDENLNVVDVEFID